MDKLINTSIYITYLVIAVISITISYQVNIVMCLIVVAIELVRLTAIYKKVYSVIILVFILNVYLIGYNGYKAQMLIEYNNTQIMQNNTTTSDYIAKKDLKAITFEKFKASIATIDNVSIDWWLLVGVYIVLELSLIMLIIGINRQEWKQRIEPIKIAKEPQRTIEKEVQNEEIKQQAKNDNKNDITSNISRNIHIGDGDRPKHTDNTNAIGFNLFNSLPTTKNKLIFENGVYTFNGKRIGKTKYFQLKKQGV
jgi:hypothetical protein